MRRKRWRQEQPEWSLHVLTQSLLCAILTFCVLFRGRTACQEATSSSPAGQQGQFARKETLVIRMHYHKPFILKHWARVCHLAFHNEVKRCVLVLSSAWARCSSKRCTYPFLIWNCKDWHVTFPVVLCRYEIWFFFSPPT
jgi:hypothetical protein